MDVDTIKPGLDFVEAIESAVDRTDAMIVVIGPNWLGAVDAAGNRRLDNPEDFVRLEIAASLERNVRVIPVLVKRAEMPGSAELPDDLKALARRNALELSHTRFNSDAQRLINALELALEQAEADREEEARRIESERAEPEHLAKDREEAGHRRLAREKAETERLADEGALSEGIAAEPREATASSVRETPAKQRTERKRLPAWRWASVVVIPIALLGLWIAFVRDTDTQSDAALKQQAAVERAATLTRGAFEADMTTTVTPTTDPNLPPRNAKLGDTWTRPKDGMEMVYVPPPETPFVLEGGLDAPQEGYWIDKYEVSNAQYQLCHDAGACDDPPSRITGKELDVKHPVRQVYPHEALAYSAWVGGELPTEAEWEYAAVGDAGTDYPWGNEASCELANLTGCTGEVAAVDSYPDGASWVGALNMAGNVWEWTDVVFNEESESGILRGGSCCSSLRFRQHYTRTGIPLTPGIGYGFRVVLRSPTE